MMTRSEVESAHENAIRALKEKGHLTWIRQSAWFERAYRFGVAAGLSAAADADSVNAILGEALVRTIFVRSADDSFSSTEIGRRYDSLRSRLAQDRGGHLSVAEDAQALLDLVEKHAREWNARLDEVRLLLCEVVAGGPRGVGGLESALRFIALVETSHHWWERIVKDASEAVD